MSVDANQERSVQPGATLWQFKPSLKCRLLVMQATAFCNISCDYCYLAHRDDTRRMPDEVIEATAQRLIEGELLDRCLGIIWHAGEPLAAGLSFYETAFQRFARILGHSTQVCHAIQTNATLINERWCDLFRRWSVRVGVSLDGPAAIHDKHRQTRTGRPTFQRVMRGIELLQRAEIPFHVIAVVTRDSLDKVDEIVDFFVEHGIHEVGFNIDEQEGANSQSTVSNHANDHRAFLQRLLDRTVADPARLNVRELEVAARLIMQKLPSVSIDGNARPDNAQVLPFAILSIATNGDVSTFSPELVDQSHPSYGRLVFGNVLTTPLPAILQQEGFRKVYTDILAGVERCRTSCEYFEFCGGGAPANKLSEHGSFTAAETDYCCAVIKRPLSVVLERFEYASNDLEQRSRSSLVRAAATPPMT